MKRQVPFISSIRRPVRTLIFVLLVGLATFGFVSRAVEYTILTREINRIAGFYRTTGSLVPVDARYINNVYDAINIFSGSNLIEFEDRRTITQGVMHGHNNRLRGAHTINNEFYFMGGEAPFAYKGLYPFDSLVIVEIRQIIPNRNLRLTDEYGVSRDILTTRVDFTPHEVLVGHSQFLPGRRYMTDFIVDENGNTIVDGFRVGERYLVRASGQSPANNVLSIFPLLEGLYFVPVSDTETIDYVFAALSDELAILEENTSMLMITGTKDMSALPMVQTNVIERTRGRFITYEDYLNANPVIVVPHNMLPLLGETITLTLRDMRTFVDGSPLPPEGHPVYHILANNYGAAGQWQNIPAGYWVSIPRDYEGNWQQYPTVEIDVEVIGTYAVSLAWRLPRWMHIRNSYFQTEVFMPASIIPEGFGIVDAHFVTGQYSFVLTSPEAIRTFTVRYRDALAEAGFTMQFTGPNHAQFLSSIVPIRMAIRLNLVLFTAVLVLVLSLTVFLYLRQRYKEFAIMRTLGVSAKKSILQLIVPILVFWLPIVIVSSVFAWHFALGRAGTGLEILEDFDTHADYTEEYVFMNIIDRLRHEAEQAIAETPPKFSVLQLVWLIGALLATWVGAVLIGVVFFIRQSMISLIQSSQGGGARIRMARMAKETAPPTGIKVADILLLPAAAISPSGRIKSALRYHMRHILRMPVKTLLVVGITLLFISALGWLNSTILFTESEIERLHASIPVTGEVVDPIIHENIHELTFGYNIPQHTINILQASGFLDSYYYTMISGPETGMGLFPYVSDAYEFEFDWMTSTRAGAWPVMNTFKSFNCWETFVYESTAIEVFGTGLGEPFSLTFATGYSWEDFIFIPRYTDVIPVIVHESLLERDLIISSHGVTHYNPWLNGELLEQRLYLGGTAYWGWSGSPNEVPLKIIGVYRGGHPRSAYSMGRGLVLMPEHSLQWYIAALTFSIRQDMLPYLYDLERGIAEQLMYLILHPVTGQGINARLAFENHTIILDDAELREVVTPLEQNLNLLRLLYPIAMALSFVLALGLVLLLMLQNAHNAAILRVLGTPRYKVRAFLCLEQLAVCAAGLVAGFIAALVMGVSFGTAGMFVGIFLAGAVIGVVAGVVVISNKTPIELLQVRE